MLRPFKNLLLALSLTAILSSCVGGSRGELTCEEAIYPVSLTESTFLKDHTVATKEDYDIVEVFEMEYKAWAMVWGLAAITGSIEFGDAVNEQVKASGGHAVQDLRVEVSNSAMNMVPVLTLLPFWPNFATLKVTGNIIRYKNI